jgi:hypothetical protein
MSLPSCFDLLNADFFSGYNTQISSVTNQAELQALADRIMADLSLVESTLTSQMSFLTPLLALLTPPGANLAQIVTWITGLITFLQEMYKPYANAVAQIAALPAEIATLTAAIEAAASRLGVSITIPPVTIGCTL